jgi:hypothetical protein
MDSLCALLSKYKLLSMALLKQGCSGSWKQRIECVRFSFVLHQLSSFNMQCGGAGAIADDCWAA